MREADSAGFRRDVEAAAVGWAFVSVAWFLPRALADDRTPDDPNKPTPNRRASILHRLDLARRSADGPALAELAARLHHTLTARWGDLTLPTRRHSIDPKPREPAHLRNDFVDAVVFVEQCCRPDS
jgi:hypothetical protein